jgi:YD repeat-containing protein
MNFSTYIIYAIPCNLPWRFLFFFNCIKLPTDFQNSEFEEMTTLTCTNMPRFLVLILILFLLACGKSNNGPLRLIRKETPDNTGKAFVTEYVYDGSGRITTIKQAQGTETPTVSVTITYAGNEVTLKSTPTYDPSYTIAKEVRLTLDANGKLVKRIGAMLFTGKQGGPSAPKRFILDTLVCNYDANGFLSTARRGAYDSTWNDPNRTSVQRGDINTRWTVTSGKLTLREDDVVYLTISTLNGTQTKLSGSSQFQTKFFYTKSYPNKMDFSNAAVHNEVVDYANLLDYYNDYSHFEPYLDKQFVSLPDKSEVHSVDRDINGNITFNYTSTYDLVRSYNGDGLQSMVENAAQTPTFPKIQYFYGR